MSATTDVLDRLTRLEERVDELEHTRDTVRSPSRPRIGMTIEEVKAKLDEPVERRPEDLAQLQQMFGSFSGPRDLSARMRDYLYGDKKFGDE